MSPDDFRAAIDKIRASVGQPLVLQERLDIVPPWLAKGEETPAEALARHRANEAREIMSDNDREWEAAHVVARRRGKLHVTLKNVRLRRANRRSAKLSSVRKNVRRWQ